MRIPLVLCGLGLSAVASAATVHSVPGDYDSLTLALALVPKGDIIEVDPNYTPAAERLFIEKSLTLRGKGGQMPLLPAIVINQYGVVDNPPAVVLQDLRIDGQTWIAYAGDELTTSIVMTNGALTLDNVRVEPGAHVGLALFGVAASLVDYTAKNYTMGVPLYVVGAPTETLIDGCDLRGNQLGAALLLGGAARFTGCTFADNQAELGADVLAQDAAILIEDSTFSGGSADTAGSIAVLDGNLLLRRAQFTNYSAGSAAILMVAADFLGPIRYATLEEVTVDGARADTGVGGLAFGGAIDVSVSDSTFRDVQLHGEGEGDLGGVMSIEDGSLSVVDSLFEDFHGVFGGAIFAVGGADVHVTNTTFRRTSAASAPFEATYGGAIGVYEGFLELRGTRFEGMRADGDGGGVVMVGGELDAVDVVFTDNHAVATGGALRTFLTDVHLDEVTIEQSSAGYGGGAMLTGGHLELWRLAVEDNTAMEVGGGLALRGPQSLDLWHSVICGNQAPTDPGVQLAGGLSDKLRVENSRFMGNVGQGAALAWRLAVPDSAEPELSSPAAHLAVVNNSFVGNQTPAGALGVWWGSQVTITNDLFASNPLGAGLYGDGTQLHGGYNLWWGNDVAWSPVGLATGEGNVFEDPMFVDEDPTTCGANLWLHVDSPARNAGDLEIRNADGRRSDIGAWGGPWTGLEDLDGDGWLQDADCDESDTSVNPDAVEVWYNDHDEDCDGNDADRDEDGHLSALVGGGDCDDDDSSVNPDADDVLNDGIDQNCDEVFDGSRVRGGGGCATTGARGLSSLALFGFLLGWRRSRSYRGPQ